ncbi:membrane protein [Capnocytophaga stomatis]|uniref:Diadenylate cyclase n=1 Tax=Capnocytophaga stomatis TaxID=1848904 RepID=A0A250FU36_9FLAO|nr:diadenylate cyclase [Capnocytophaga stomatis]ATA88630.1 TIGR00159 family protein [Capnocytophaga stomatis]GIJ96486.1 membrane protein [Capnocytophaga stomatis]GIM50214.1 membrane protein [Capnocytophaga stomatis]
MKIFDILDFTVVDVIDILLVALLLYYVYKLARGTVAVNIFLGIVIIYLIWKITEALQMQLLSSILGQFIGVGVFALIVVFQEEIRKFLLTIGSTNIAARNKFFKVFQSLKTAKNKSNLDVRSLISVCKKLGSTNTGALIVLERNIPLNFVKETGDDVNIQVSEPIIESIFFKNSPLHDGAIVISGNYIVATRVILPVAGENRLPKHYGLRHRAATSISEKTDASALVVSEETGKISYIKNGNFVAFKTDEELINIIENDLN